MFVEFDIDGLSLSIYSQISQSSLHAPLPNSRLASALTMSPHSTLATAADITAPFAPSANTTDATGGHIGVTETHASTGTVDARAGTLVVPARIGVPSVSFNIGILGSPFVPSGSSNSTAVVNASNTTTMPPAAPTTSTTQVPGKDSSANARPTAKDNKHAYATYDEAAMLATFRRLVETEETWKKEAEAERKIVVSFLLPSI